MPTHIGYFHFGGVNRESIPELRSALMNIETEKGDKGREIAGSLIVIPEGFNIRKTYIDTATMAYIEPGVFSDLRMLAAQFKVTFVAALITRLDWASGQPKPYNSAYLITSTDEPKIICRKHEDDGWENYSRCFDEYDVENPISHDEFQIGAFICRDADEEGVNRTRHEMVSASVVDPSKAVMCLPACGTRHSAPSMVKGWGCKYVVYANSNRNGESFIGVNEEVKEPTPKHTSKNFIKLWPCAQKQKIPG
jgi:hypothetical protein